MQLLSLVFSTFALLFSVVSLVCYNKNTILMFQIPANICYSISYMLSGAMVAGIGVVIATIRTIVFFIYSRSGHVAPRYFLIIFLLLTAGAGLVNFDYVVDMLPVIGMSVFTYATWQKNENVLKLGAIILSSCLLIYNSIVGLYISCLQEIILLSCAMWSVVKINKLK